MTNHLTHNNSVTLSIGFIVFKGSGGSRSWDKWGAGSQKILFSVLRASVWSKNKGLGGGGAEGPPDLSLGSTTEGSGPVKGLFQTITHVFEPSQLFLYQKSWPCLGQAHVIEYTLQDKKRLLARPCPVRHTEVPFPEVGNSRNQRDFIRH